MSKVCLLCHDHWQKMAITSARLQQNTCSSYQVLEEYSPLEASYDCDYDTDSFLAAPTQSPSYADTSPGNVNLPLSMDPVLAVVTNASGQQVMNVT